MDMWQIITLVSTVGGVALSALSALITFIVKCKNAKSEADKQTAINELKESAIEFIKEAETAYKDVDAILKSQGKAGSGAVKKDSVMTKLLNLAITKKVVFDKEYWSKAIDELVELTRKVNTKK